MMGKTGEEEKDKPAMSDAEKQKLGVQLEELIAELPDNIIKFLKKSCLNSSEVIEDEIEIDTDIDIEALSDDKLFTLRKLLDDYLLEKKRKHSKPENHESEMQKESESRDSSYLPCEDSENPSVCDADGASILVPAELNETANNQEEPRKEDICDRNDGDILDENVEQHPVSSDVLDDFEFYDCRKAFISPMSDPDRGPSPKDKSPPPAVLRRRRSGSSQKSSGDDSRESMKLSCLESVEKKLREKKELEDTEVVSPKNEMSEEKSMIIDANTTARGEDSNSRRNDELNSSLLFTFTEYMCEWLKEQRAVLKLGLKCGWGLFWSAYVCSMLVGLLVLAFVIGGVLIKVAVEEPIRMTTGLNFDYSEKSPVALVPIMSIVKLNHEVRHFLKKPKFLKADRSRVVPRDHRVQVTVSLILPESEYNQHLGMFQVRVDFLAADGQILTTSRRPCMLQYRSPSIRLLLTLLKVAPILTGYISETQNLKVHFQDFTEGDTPTTSLRVVLEQRAEYSPGAGIPEIYNASLTLESELPLLKRMLWFWKKTLLVWVSMAVFMMELVFALLCCRPLIIPKIRLLQATPP